MALTVADRRGVGVFSHRAPQGWSYDGDDGWDPDAGWGAAEARLVLVAGALTRDEYLDGVNRRGLYVACRRVDTVDRDAVRRAGL